MSTHIFFLVNKDMDVNKYKTLFNFTFRHKFEIITVLHFSHSRVFSMRMTRFVINFIFRILHIKQRCMKPTTRVYWVLIVTH